MLSAECNLKVMTMRLVACLCFAVAAAFIIGGALRIEQSDFAAEVPLATAGMPVGACPDKDNLPYSDRCIQFFAGGPDSAARGQIESSLAVMPRAPSAMELIFAAPVCAANDKLPSSERCLAFLKGSIEPSLHRHVGASD
jgi:hypothetical protein